MGLKPNLFLHEKPVNSVEQAINMSRTRHCWIVNYLSDYKGFDFLWEPTSWESHQAHVWPSQHQQNGGTWLLPKQGFIDVNRNHSIVPRVLSAPRLHLHHWSSSPNQGDRNARYIHDYLGTMRRCLDKVDWEWCWVTADVCDYSRFDFSWHPSEWQENMLHVFASDDQKFGDTFYVHVPSFKINAKNTKLLEWYNILNFVPNCVVPRQRMPIVKHSCDTHVEKVKSYEFEAPLVVFTNSIIPDNLPAICLWREETKAVTPLSNGAEVVIVPREVKSTIHNQLYDYAHIDKSHNQTFVEREQDIFFISYDEPEAEKNWHTLVSRFPRAKRIKGIKGLENAYGVAAEESTTPWYWAVFAKTTLYDTFDFSFCPDRLQQPKHYIFYSKNPLNQLEYGHMGIKLYNCNGVKQTLADGNPGLDFTMSYAHETVPVLSCYGNFNQTPYHTWRTAFREVIKLCYFQTVRPTVENNARLHIWLTVADGNFADWCLKGAADANNFFQCCDKSMLTLKNSNDWQWLKDYFNLKYQDINGQTQ